MVRRGLSDDAALPASWLPVLHAKVRPPVCVALGSPRRVADLVEQLGLGGAVLFQMDLHQAERLGQLLADRGLSATVATLADLWDLTGDFQTVLFPVEPQGERMLKVDVLEQAYHVLKPHGTLMVLSPTARDQFFPPALKKIYGRVHTPDVAGGTLLWCQRAGDRPRRRHEITYQVSGEPPRRFLSRPGVFSYGRFDNGARALVEVAEIHPGDRILDLGCGCGTNGVLCGLRAGAGGHVTFVDSRYRAAALARLNAEANGLTDFDVRTASRLHDVAPRSFDVVLANPPYYANLGIAQRFAEGARPLLKPGGRMYLVTKQPETVGPMVAEQFGVTQAVECRGYVVLCATAESS
jgi:16S rRNA (guanine1207-N2)-methyltransferase